MTSTATPQRRKSDRVRRQARSVWVIFLRISVAVLGVQSMAYAIWKMDGAFGSARWAVGLSGFWTVAAAVAAEHLFT